MRADKYFEYTNEHRKKIEEECGSQFKDDEGNDQEERTK